MKGPGILKSILVAVIASLAAGALKKLAHRADKWDVPQAARGNIEFFVERFLNGSAVREHEVA